MGLHLQVEGSAATLFIDRAEKRNAFTQAMWTQLPVLLAQVANNPELRLLVLRAAEEGAFCAGADIAEMVANKDDADWRSANQAAINRAQWELARLPIPTIAFVDGDCIGGGCGLALACDIRAATERARFGITPAKLGLVYPLHDVKLLIDLVGPGQAKRLLYTGALIDAAEALRIGLVETIVDSPDAIAQGILAASPHSNRQLKRFVRRVLDGLGVEDAESGRAFAEAFTLPDFQEGTAAFLQKRPPRFGPGS